MAADPLTIIARICDEQPHDALTQIADALGYTEQHAAYQHDRAYTDGMVFARQCIGAPTTMEKADAALRKLDAVIQRRHAQEVEYRAERRTAGVTPTRGPLTKDEVDALVYRCRQAGDDSTYALVRAVEATHGVKGRAHVLYSDADKDRPDVICDRNGQVVLDLCKVCGKAEAELLDHPECPGTDGVLGLHTDQQKGGR